MLYTVGCGAGQIYRAITNSKHWTVVTMPLVKSKKRSALIHTTTRELKVQFFRQCLCHATASRFLLTVYCRTVASRSQHTLTTLHFLRAFSSRTPLHQHQLSQAPPMEPPSHPLPAQTLTAPMDSQLTRLLLHTCRLKRAGPTRMTTALPQWTPTRSQIS